MAGPQAFAAQNLVDITLTTTTETVALTMPAISTPNPGSPVAIAGTVNITTGTGTTGLIVRVRRGTTITGTLIGEAPTLTAAAAQTSEQGFDRVDIPGEVAGQAYVITVQQVGSTGNGTILNCAAEIVVGP